MSDTANTLEKEVNPEDGPVKNNKVKGILYGIFYGFTAAMFLVIPTKLILSYWVVLNSLMINDMPIYTLALFILFLYIIAVVISVIFVAAMCRCFYQRKNPDLGISRGVRGFAIVSVFLVIGFMIFWFLITGGQIAFFGWNPPV